MSAEHTIRDRTAIVGVGSTPYYKRGRSAPFDGGALGLVSAARQLGRSGTDAQLGAAAKVLAETRRSLYLILAEDPSVLGETGQQADGPDGGNAS